MSPSLFSSEQLAAVSGKSLRTIRHHVKHGWLKPEPKFPGVRGWRFTEEAARAWLRLHYPARRWDHNQMMAPAVEASTGTHTAQPEAHYLEPLPPPTMSPPAPTRPAGAWKQSLHHESAHYIVAGVAACGARVPEGTPWHDHTTGLRRCTRCMPKAL